MGNTRTKAMESEYDFSKGERGRFYHPNTTLHLPVNEDTNIVPEMAEDYVEESAWLQAAANNPAFDFLKDAAEDIYSPTDGRPFCEEE